METIRLWLNGNRDYAAGVKLFLLYGKDKLLKRLFTEEACTDYKKKKLIEVLQGMLLENKADATEAATPQKNKIRVVKEEQAPDQEWSKTFDDVEAALHAKWKPLYVEMMDLCSRLGDVSRAGKKYPGKKLEAGKMVFRILDLDDQCDDIYSQRDFYRENKRLPEAKGYGQLCVDPLQVPTKLKNHERYVRQYKTQLSLYPANVEAAKNLQKHEWYVAEYKKILKIN